MGELAEDGPDDMEGLDASAAHIANLLSTEPRDGNKQTKQHQFIFLLSFIV